MKRMAGVGVHLALGPEDTRRLLAARSDAAVLDVLRDVQKRGDGTREAISGGAWDAIHRCLSNGTLFYDEGEYPLNRTVLGGKHLYAGDDHVVAYVSPQEVRDVTASLAAESEGSFRARYDVIDPDDYDAEHGEADFKLAWTRFQAIRELFGAASREGCSVVFAVDL